ncbi:hypothetical protein ANN_04338 [Periplaneta americana]|uniref:Uncharacterized protein n=1 Tax=Periplaneta americana TaxID=6978 RepID=A0ABQ8TA38_PERAM|nr:hypothetical protein ANN_04338 [Periplaneta americana]
MACCQSKCSYRRFAWVGEVWKDLKEVVTNAADEALGRVGSPEYNNWFDEECELMTMEKNKAYKKMLQKNHTRRAVEEYREARREEKKVHKKKKREFAQARLVELEQLRDMNETRAFFKKLNNMRKDFQPRTTMCKDKQDVILGDDKLILERWAQHFDELWNIEIFGNLDGGNDVESSETHEIESNILGVQFKVCHGSLYAVTWLVDEPREFNLPTIPQRCITYLPEKLPSKYGVHSEEVNVCVSVRVSVVSGMSDDNDDDDDEEGRRGNPVLACSLLLSNSTKGATTLNIPIRWTNHYQQ